jgi:hypothetical protein
MLYVYTPPIVDEADAATSLYAHPQVLLIDQSMHQVVLLLR